ncbi:MAG: hypothetical protein H3C36_09175 [Chitinophagaceae bacterium]|nr:hypothetical protein [Chitinophagaceae bacterium]MCO5285556.1 hypothetical protein [Chitinophagaceae bacterium]MCZ2395667.1 hypothetical protein [Chitinophagales bacterium]
MRKYILSISGFTVGGLFIAQRLMAQTNEQVNTEAPRREFMIHPWIWSVGGFIVLLILIVYLKLHPEPREKLPQHLEKE